MSFSISFDERRIDALLEPYDQVRQPGVAVGIAIRGRPVYRKGFGLASVEQPVVLTPGVRMRIGSTTKHFAALAYLLLCEEGRAGLEDPLSRYVPEAYPASRNVTMRQLMGHVAGIRDVFDITWQFSGTSARVSSGELLAMYGDIADVNAPPMSTWIYNNGGYLLLSVAIERIASLPLEAVLEERVLARVGMHDTLLRRRESDLVPNSATNHLTRPDGGYERSPFFGTEFAGEGGLSSTVDDMLRWLAHMDAPRVGCAETWRILTTPLTLANGTPTGYGMGLFRTRYRGLETLSHPGGGMGGTAQMLKAPDVHLDVVVMANRDDASPMAIADGIVDACVEGLDPPDTAAATHLATGTFQSRGTGRVIELAAVEDRQVARIDGMEVTLRMEGGAALRPTGLARVFNQAIVLEGDRERPISIRFIDYGIEDRLERAPPPASGGSAIEGSYRSGTTGTSIEIHAQGAGSRMVTRGRFGSLEYELAPLARDTWRALPTRHTLGGVLTLAPDRSGLRFSCPRTWALGFRRMD